MDKQQPKVEALVFEGDKILASCSNTAILVLQGIGDETKLIDFAGLTILPGFNKINFLVLI